MIYPIVNSTGVAYVPPAAPTVTWTARAAASASIWQAVTSGSGTDQIVTAVSGTDANMNSLNAITWSADTSGNNISYNAVDYSSTLGRFVAVGAPGGGSQPLKYSDNGSSWTLGGLSPKLGDWYGVAWCSGFNLFVAVGGNSNGPGFNNAFSTPDGTTLTARSTATSETWLSVCYSPSLNRAVAVRATGTNRSMYTDDGITWTESSTPGTNAWRSVCWAESLGLFVAVATGGTNQVMYSADGISWTVANAAEANAWQSVCWSESLGLLVAVSSDGTNRSMFSLDGITWTAAPTSEQNSWSSVCWSEFLGLFVAVSFTGTNRVMTGVYS